MEAGGIPTVVIGVHAFRDRLEAMRLPRVLITPFPMGRTLGAPGDRAKQREVIVTALKLLETATLGGTMVEFTETYHVSS